MLLKSIVFLQKVSDKNDDEVFLRASVNRLRIGKLNQNPGGELPYEKVWDSR